MGILLDQSVYVILYLHGFFWYVVCAERYIFNVVMIIWDAGALRGLAKLCGGAGFRDIFSDEHEDCVFW